MENKGIVIRMPPEIRKLAEESSRKLGLTMSSYIRMLIAQAGKGK